MANPDDLLGSATLHSARFERDPQTLGQLATKIEARLADERDPLDPPERGRLLYALALTEQKRHSNQETAQMLEKAMELLSEKDPSNAASAAAGLAVYLLVIGDVNTAVDRAGDAYTLLEGVTVSTAGSVLADVNLSTFFLHLGALEQSAAHAEAAFHQAQRLADDDVTVLAGRFFLYNGLEVVRQYRTVPEGKANRDRWLAACLDGATYLHERGPTSYVRNVVGNEALAWVFLELGKAKEARERLEHADEARMQMDWPLAKESDRERSRRFLLDAIIWCTLGEVDRAWEAFSAVSPLIRQGTDWVLQMRCLEEEATCLAALGEYERAYRALVERTESVQANLVVRNDQLARLLHSRVDLTMRADRLASSVETDSLTGIRSRRYLDDFLAQQKPNVPTTVFVIDVDHFKDINDRHGHLVGDQVLASIAQILADKSRPGDLVCRFGGEEFVIIPSEAMSDDRAFAQRLRVAVEDHDFSHIDRQLDGVEVTISVGYCTGEAAEIEVVLGRADRAMFEAKRLGRNRVVGWTKDLGPEEWADLGNPQATSRPK